VKKFAVFHIKVILRKSTRPRYVARLLITLLNRIILVNIAYSDQRGQDNVEHCCTNIEHQTSLAGLSNSKLLPLAGDRQRAARQEL
jgi:hypothetical protein